MKNQCVRNSKCLDIHFLWVATDHFGEYKWRQSTKGFRRKLSRFWNPQGLDFFVVAEQDCANWIDHNLRFILTASLIYPLSWKPVSFAMNLFHSFAPAQPSPSPSSGSGKSCSKIFLMLIADSSLILYRPFSRSVYIGVLENDRCLISFHSCDADADGVYIGVLGVDWYYISFHSWPTAAAVYFKATGVSLNIFILLSPQVFVSEEILWISTEHHNSKKLIVFLENSNN